MAIYRFLTIAVLLLMVSCTSPSVPPLSEDHPANPDVTAVPLPSPSPTFSLAEAAPIEPSVVQSSALGTHEGHDHGEAPNAAENKSAPDQSHQHDQRFMKDENDSATQPAAQSRYVCPMHPEVTSDKPSKCPKCGMKLVEKDRSNSEHGDHE